MTATRLAALVAVLVLALAGCGTAAEEVGSDATGETPSPSPATQDDPEDDPDDDADGRVPPEETPAPPGDAPLAEGLDVTLPAVGGGQVVGAELAGRDLALWFWAPW